MPSEPASDPIQWAEDSAKRLVDAFEQAISQLHLSATRTKNVRAAFATAFRRHLEEMVNPLAESVDSGSSQRRFGPPGGRIRRFGEPTHTTTYTYAESPTACRVKVPNEAYEHPVQVECEQDHVEHRRTWRHLYAVAVHQDDQGVPVAFFALLGTEDA